MRKYLNIDLGCIVGGSYACINRGACQSTGYCSCPFGYQGAICETCTSKTLKILINYLLFFKKIR